MRTALFCLTIALAPFATSTTAFAQRNSASATFDISVGMIHRGGEIYADHTGFVLDGVGALPLRSFAGGRLLGAIRAGFDLFASSDVCAIDPHGGCRPGAGFRRVALMAGWQKGDNVALRVSAGPAYYDEVSVSRGYESAIGVEGGIDFSVPLLPHVGVVASARGATLPSIRNGSVPMAAGTVGLRLR